jgi:translation initiation factor IF-3
MSTRDALGLSESRDLDLVKIAPSAVPPVCKIMDYGKFLFERKKKSKEARRNQHISELKEIRLSVNIGEGDMRTKAGHVKEFIEDGNKVKIYIRFKGREGQHPEIGRKVMSDFCGLCSEFASVEGSMAFENRQMSVILSKK